MQVIREGLSSAVDGLERVLADGLTDGPRVWAARVDQALAQVERAARRQDGVLESPGGGLVDVGSGQSPSPGMDRQVEHLEQALADLLTEASAVRKRLGRLMESDALVHHPALDGLFRRVVELHDALVRHARDEVWLIFDTACTDIGAGD